MNDCLPVIPAKAGTQLHRGQSAWSLGRNWVPAFAGMTMAGAALLLAGCGAKAPRDTGNPKIDSAQAAADAASTAYAGCVDKAAKAIDVSLDQPPALADKALKQCIAERGTAVDKVHKAEMARGGDEMIAMEIAERSLRVADDELRDRANAAIVVRKYSDKKAS